MFAGKKSRVHCDPKINFYLVLLKNLKKKSNIFTFITFFQSPKSFYDRKSCFCTNFLEIGEKETLSHIFSLSYTHTYTHTHTHTLLLSYTLSHTRNLTHTLSLIHTKHALTCTHTHTHSLPLTNTRTHLHSHSHTLSSSLTLSLSLSLSHTHTHIEKSKMIFRISFHQKGCFQHASTRVLKI